VSCYSDFVAKLGSPGPGGNYHCPVLAHGDRNPSLSVTEASDGKVLVKCHAGCPTEKVVEALGLKMNDLFPDSQANGQRHVVARYNYRDEQGKILYQSVRYEPKDFKQRRRINNAWVNNMDGVRRVLYRLPELLKGIEDGRIVFIVEGEKDVESLHEIGLVSTTNVGGAGKVGGTGKWRAEYSECLKGARVVIIPDADDAGREHGDAVAKSLHGIAKSVKILTLPKGKDATDWIEKHGGTKKGLLSLAKEAEKWEPTNADDPGKDRSEEEGDRIAHRRGAVGGIAEGRAGGEAGDSELETES
jgi:5S rRNA maturation endonuclease (ribonuclease M5)